MIEERIKNIRKATGLSQRKFAEKVGISFGSIQIYEKDASSLTIKSATRIAETCGFNPIWLIAGFGEMQDCNDIKNCSESPDNLTLHPKVKEHIEIANNFGNKEAALAISKDLVEIEQISDEAFENIGAYIKGIKNGLQMNLKNDRRKRDLPFNPPDKRKKVG